MPNEHIKEIRKVTWAGVVVNILLAMIKFIFGMLGHSRAVVADAVHSLSDLSTDFAVILGVKYWSKPADEDHPYGHGRIESLVTVFISLALMTVAVGIGYQAVVALKSNTFAHPGAIAFLAALVSVFSKEWLYRWTVQIGRKVKSPAVIANAWHHRTDAMSSIPVCVTVVIAMINPSWAYWDSVGAFVVSLFILYTAWGLLMPVFAEFIGEGASQKECKAIEKIVSGISGVRSMHKIRTRKQGSGWYVDLHVQVDPLISVKEGHDIATAVKFKLLDEGPDILDVIVHVEPD